MPDPITYRALDPDEAVAAGASEELVTDLRPFSSWDAPASGVFRLVDGVPVELIGSDGGEVEDQTLGRDWAWVPGALQAAYERGRQDQLVQLSPDELAGALLDGPS